MPHTLYALTLLSVAIAAAVTVWLLSLGGPTMLAIALPATMIATVTLKALPR